MIEGQRVLLWLKEAFFEYGRVAISVLGKFQTRNYP